MRKTTFTFNQRGRMRNKVSSKLQFAIITALFFTLFSMATGLQAQCNLTCEDEVSISLGMDGRDTIIVDDILQSASPGCSNLFVIAYDENNDPVPDNIVDCSFINRTLSVGLYDSQGNNCWTDVTILDKMAPLITCVNDTITCGEAIDYPLPVLVDNCSPPSDITIIEHDDFVVPLHCDSFFTSMIIRTLRAEDGNGNQTPDSLVCNDTLFVERIDFSSLTRPVNQTNHNGSNPGSDDALYCNESNWTDTNGNGIPEPGEPGVNVPTLNGQPFLPGHIKECSADLMYEDAITTSDCKTKIFRTYTAREWHCDSVIPISFLHMITIVDDNGPVVIPPADFTATTNGSSCDIDVVIPAATVTDDCNSISRYQIVTPFGNEIRNSVVPITVNLPVGTHTILIRAYDACDNVGTAEMEVTVIDNTNPIAVCDLHTAVGLTNNGYARVFATTFDDGSFDDCEVDRFEVRRMNRECDGTVSIWRDYVEFCCTDIPNNPIMVEFRVFDKSGNSNTCMVEVEVQDKIAPQYSDLPRIRISCEMDRSDLSVFGSYHVINNLNDLNDPATDPRDSINFDDPGDLYNGERFYGIDAYVFDNCAASVVELPPYERINRCQVGYITRRFSIRDGAGNEITQRYQRIDIVNFKPFDSNVRFPRNITLRNNGVCNSGSLSPEWLRDNRGERYGFPRKIEDRCDQLSTAHTDVVFHNTNPDSVGCFKIMRTWKVLDWCDGSEPMITHVQIIEVINTIAPTITSTCEDVILFSSNEDCDSRYVDLMLNATDDCTPQEDLDYRWAVYPFGDKNSPDAVFGTSNNASNNYPIGTHLIEWSVEDKCGNSSDCSFYFTVDNRKAATPVAINGLSVDLMPLDLDQDGVFDGGMLELTPKFFDGGSFHSCGIDFTLSFSSDPNDTIMRFDCDHVGPVEVELWTHSANGTTSFVRTYVLIQANDGQCGPGNNGPTYPVGGLVSGLTNQGVPSVSMFLEGTNAEVMTGNDGQYSFNPMPEGGNYTVMPKLDKDLLNGVTTWDLSLIQRHILKIEEITDPYLLIAADINNDKKISGKDLTTLRRAILGLEEEFRNNTSWRFIDAAYSFNSTNPLAENFPESYDIRNLNSNMTGVNFIGAKIGDIDKSVDLSGLTRFRTNSNITLTLDDANYVSGDVVRVPVMANSMNIDAIQYTMNYNAGLVFEGVEAGILNMSAENIAVHTNGMLTTSWNAVSSIEVNENDVLYTLVFKATNDVKLSNGFEINSEITPALAYTSGEEKGIDVEFRTLGSETTYALFQNTPNPAVDYTIIGFNLGEASEATLTIYNLTGSVVKEVRGEFEQGYNEVKIDLSSMGAEGVLYYRLDAGEFTASKKMIVLK